MYAYTVFLLHTGCVQARAVRIKSEVKAEKPLTAMCASYQHCLVVTYGDLIDEINQYNNFNLKLPQKFFSVACELRLHRCHELLYVSISH